MEKLFCSDSFDDFVDENAASSDESSGSHFRCFLATARQRRGLIGQFSVAHYLGPRAVEIGYKNSSFLCFFTKNTNLDWEF